MLGYEADQLQYVRSVLSGHQSLRGRDAKDRIGHLFTIYNLASTLLGGTTQARQWLSLEQETLGGRSPFELLREGSMENVLIVRRFVEYACGHAV